MQRYLRKSNQQAWGIINRISKALYQQLQSTVSHDTLSALVQVHENEAYWPNHPG